MRLFGVLLTMFAVATTAAAGEASKSMPVPPSPVSPKSSTTARGEVTNIAARTNDGAHDLGLPNCRPMV
jgi:hypothetical protein